MSPRALLGTQQAFTCRPPHSMWLMESRMKIKQNYTSNNSNSPLNISYDEYFHCCGKLQALKQEVKWDVMAFQVDVWKSGSLEVWKQVTGLRCNHRRFYQKTPPKNVRFPLWDKYSFTVFSLSPAASFTAAEKTFWAYYRKLGLKLVFLKIAALFYQKCGFGQLHLADFPSCLGVGKCSLFPPAKLSLHQCRELWIDEKMSSFNRMC